MKKTLLAIFLMVCASTVAHSQLVYSRWSNPSGHYSSSRSPSDALSCNVLGICATISNVANVANNSFDDYATVNFPLLAVGAVATIEMELEQPVVNGSRGGVFIESLTSLLSLTVAPSITVSLLNGSTVIASETYSSLLDLSLISQTAAGLCVVPATPLTYNKVRVSISLPVSVGLALTFRVYFGFGNSAPNCPSPLLAHNGLNFRVYNEDRCGAKLQWNHEDENEKTTSYFEIQRRTSDQQEWKPIAKINAANASNRRNEFTYTDYPRSAGRMEYRVVSAMSDGNFKYYPARAITVDCDSPPINVYPTVTHQRVNIESTGAAGQWQIRLTDINGRTQSAPVQRNGSRASVDVSGLSPGMYFLQVVKDGQLSTSRIVVSPGK